MHAKLYLLSKYVMFSICLDAPVFEPKLYEASVSEIDPPGKNL